MAKPTEKQLAYLEHLGVSDIPETKAEASEWIERVHSGIGFTDEQTAHLDRQRESWERERVIKHPDLYPLTPGMPGWEASVKEAIQKKKTEIKAAKTEDERDELADGLECLEMDLKDGKEQIREDEKDLREEARARIADLQRDMGPDGYFTDEIRKPTLAQVKACVEELDRTKAGWSEEYPADLCDFLKARFPELVKTAKPPPLARKTAKKKEPAGCAGVLVAGLFIGTLWMVVSWF